MEKKGVLAQSAILSLFFVSAGASVVNPALQGLAATYSSVSFTTVLLIATLPTLLYIPFSILAGTLAGSRIKFRTLALVGAALWVIGGLAPYVFPAFAAVIVARIVFGIGLGIVSPLGSALILRLYEGKERANLVGIGSALMNGGAIVFMLVAGVLAAKQVQLVWLVHAVGVIALVMLALWLPEPAKVTKVAGAPKVPTPLGVWGYILVFFGATLLFYPLLLTMSTIIEQGGLGTAAAAGLVLSVFTGGGFVSSLVFGKIAPMTGRFSLSVALALLGIGMAIIYFGNSLPMLFVGAAIAGLGSGLEFPAVMMLMGRVAPPAVIGGAVGIAMAAMKAAGFISPYYMSAIAGISGNTSVSFPVLVGAIGFVVLAAFFAVTNWKVPAVAVAEEA